VKTLPFADQSEGALTILRSFEIGSKVIRFAGGFFYGAIDSFAAPNWHSRCVLWHRTGQFGTDGLHKKSWHGFCFDRK
jgi:hypothetical protein